MTPADKLKQEALDQLDQLVKQFKGIYSRDGHLSFSDTNRVPTHEISAFNAACLGAIERIAGKAHAFSEQARTVVDEQGIASSSSVSPLYGIVTALQNDVANGRLVQLSELLHANMFGDLIEMAEHQLESGFKDPAAMLVGGALEVHLRLLCAKHGLPTADTDSSGKSRPRMGDRLNGELAKAGAYTGLDQKNVTGWLDLRNKAAHARYGEYSKEQVELFAQGVKLFIQQNPA